MVQFQWRNNTISISKNMYQKLRELSESFKVKKKSDSTSSNVVITGSDLQNFNIEFSTVGQDAMTVYELWRKQIGLVDPILIQGSLFGPDNVRLHKVAMKSEHISNSGILLNGTLTVTFEEDNLQGKTFKSKAMPYISPIRRDYFQEGPTAVEDLVLKVLYNDKDITDAIDINSCIHNMYACSKADTLDMTFNDTNKVWDGWNAEKGDLIEVICGIAKTGKMFINTVKPQNGSMILKASSIPLNAKEKKNKSWENVYTLQLAKEIADRHGLGFESYGVTDYLYSYVRQENESDFEFLQKRCELESLAFVVFDKKLILYSEKYLEEQEAAEEIELGNDSDYDYTDNALSGYGSMTIKNGNFTGVYSSSNGLSKPGEEIIQTFMSSQDEANRFAKGILRQYNKKLSSGYWKNPIHRELSAGSVINLKTTGATSWNGKVFISQIRQDYVNSTSKTFFRKAEID